MFEQLKEMIRNYVQVADEDIHRDSRFVEDLGFNSYEFMCLVGEVEDEFDIEVEEREAAKIKTVQEALDYIATLTEEWFVLVQFLWEGRSTGLPIPCSPGRYIVYTAFLAGWFCHGRQRGNRSYMISQKSGSALAIAQGWLLARSIAWKQAWISKWSAHIPNA